MGVIRSAPIRLTQNRFRHIGDVSTARALAAWWLLVCCRRLGHHLQSSQRRHHLAALNAAYRSSFCLVTPFPASAGWLAHLSGAFASFLACCRYFITSCHGNTSPWCCHRKRTPNLKEGFKMRQSYARRYHVTPLGTHRIAGMILLAGVIALARPAGTETHQHAAEHDHSTHEHTDICTKCISPRRLEKNNAVR